MALIGVAVTVTGMALFLRYSIAHFLRFWLARLSYEHQAQTDRLIAALHSAGATPVTPPAPRTTPATAPPPATATTSAPRPS